MAEVCEHGATVKRVRQAGQRAKTKMDTGGRIIIPSHLRHALGLAPGDTVVLHLEEEGETLRLVPLKTAIRRFQDAVRQLVPEGVNLVDEFIAERRAEAARE